MPTRATVADAAAARVASLRSTRRVPRAVCRADSSRRTSSAASLSYDGVQPAAVSALVVTTSGWTRKDSSLEAAGVMPIRCSRSAVEMATGRRQLDPAQPAHPLDVLLAEPPVPGDVRRGQVAPHGGELERADQVVDVAELPERRRTTQHQQPRRLEVTGHDGVDAGADQGRRTQHRDLEPGVRPPGPLRHRLHLDQVAEHRVVGVGEHLGVVVEGAVVRRLRPVHHGAGHQHHPLDPGGGGPGQRDGRTADVQRPPLDRRGIHAQVERQVHQHVDAGELAGQDRVPYVRNPPGRLGQLAAVVVDGDDLAYCGVGGQPAGERRADASGRATDGDDRLATAPCANWTGLGTHRHRAAVTVE